MLSVLVRRKLCLLFSGLGVVTALTTAWRHRRRWRAYKQLVDQWFPSSRPGLAEAMTDEEWQTLCETLLSDANFNPFETQQILAVAVTTAKGIQQ